MILKIYQQAYFENIHTNFPQLNYDEICSRFEEKFPKYVLNTLIIILNLLKRRRR